MDKTLTNHKYMSSISLLTKHYFEYFLMLPYALFLLFVNKALFSPVFLCVVLNFSFVGVVPNLATCSSWRAVWSVLWRHEADEG
jgi:hypothetical protein